MKALIRRLGRDLNMAEKILILAAFYLALFSLGGMAYEYYHSLTEPVLVQGGKYVEGAIGRVQNLNPLYAYANTLDQEVSQLLFAGLARYDSKTSEYVPDLAQSWQWESGSSAYLVTLRPDARWHDGKPLTVTDVLFTFNLLQAEEYSGPWREALKDVAVEGVSDQQVRFVLPSPNYFFLQVLSVGIVPKHKLGQLTADEVERAGFSKSPVGSGRFIFVSLKHNRSYDEVVLRPAASKAPIEQLAIRGFDSLDELWSHRGGLTAVRGVSTEWMAGNDVSDSGFAVRELELPRYGVLFFDTLSTGPTANAKVRLGIKYALNKEEITAAAGSAKLMNFPVPELDSTTVTYDLTKAASLLFEAGWGLYPKQYEDGVRRNAKGEKLTLTLATRDTPTYKAVAEVIVRQLAVAGIEIVPRPLSQSSLYQEVIRNRDYQLLLFSQDLGENEDFYPFFHSSQIIDNGANLSQYKDVKVDLVLKKIRDGQTRAARLIAVGELKDILNKEAPVIFLYQSPLLYLTREDLGKVIFPEQLSTPLDRFQNFGEWYVRAVRRWR